MRVTKEQKEQTRQKIIEAAGKGFRAHGYGGLGVDGLSKEAYVTSGAFYGHFSSKDEAFKAAIEKGMKDYADTVRALQNQHGGHWMREFLDYYLGEGHRNDLSGSCAVPGLSAEVMRADQGTKGVYEEGLTKTAEAIAENNNDEIEDALALMALLAGSVLLSRSVSSKETAEKISKATCKLIEKLSN